ncbi:hypothetical protein VX037_01700 [Gordonia sp. Z-3]|jgi:hypothetical protein|uniref:Uncharacterized protein n=2 Tax=Gordonia TaxID=2053 RepID=A0A9X3D7F0_9ACTN|nr:MULTISPECIES: hypothetical protein [Gordonia]MAU84783.1 hypothetical protein [Gordonia sp. (in: high G+C Gram-positive bacteria)]MCF3939836.1 hypothetical protein [Gordonia tangerina]MCX2966545.1 hypothetical protein [Gordonia aquimaris]MED5799747.1 hypothetical protein [Gordonia sp. Z-3]
MLLAVGFTVVIAAVLVALVVQWQRGRSPQGLSGARAAQFVQGTFTVTGVSERPDQGDAKGERFCTVSGTIVGPQTEPAEVYGTLVLGDADPWPQIGADLPVVYKPGKATSSWRFGELPPADPAQDPGPMPNA